MAKPKTPSPHLSLLLKLNFTSDSSTFSPEEVQEGWGMGDVVNPNALSLLLLSPDALPLLHLGSSSWLVDPASKCALAWASLHRLHLLPRACISADFPWAAPSFRSHPPALAWSPPQDAG